MLRKLHSLIGLIATILVVILSITAVILSVNPIIERSESMIAGTSSISVAELMGKLESHYPNAEQIQRKPSGNIVVYFTEGDKAGADLINPITGEMIGTYSSSPVMSWVKNMHRSYLLDTTGRAAAGIAAFLMLLLTISGLLMLVKQLGGWHQILKPVQGPLYQRLHSQVGRIAVLGLMLSSITGLYMSAVTFELIPDYQSEEPIFPDSVNGGIPAPVNSLSAFKNIPITELRELVYPYQGDRSDVYSITTNQGSGFVDQSTGQLLSYETYNNKQKLYELIYMLHTGEGLWWLALLLGISALAVPVMAWTGIQIWWSRKQSATTIKNNANASRADTIILVGSESNSTWGFAKTLHDALYSAGYVVHTDSMNSFRDCYSSAKRMFILTSTYGNGDAPESANQFLSHLDKFSIPPQFPVAILGFGDRQFAGFCQFSKTVESTLISKGWQQLLPLETINRQSAQEFARWGHTVGEALNIKLNLAHIPTHPNSMKMELVERVDYGEAVQSPTTIFRFKAFSTNKLIAHAKLPSFEAGDLVGILPPGSDIPRLYSLASESKDNVLEICVRLQQEGVCSSYLHSLSPGDTIDAFIKQNLSFRPSSGKAPIILVGAGTGIAPLIGFIRQNKAHRCIHLYWGGRRPDSDFLYEAELNGFLKDKRLTKLNAAFSRIEKRAYVQDKIANNGDEIRQLITQGGQILVCGGRNMANSVTAELDKVMAPLGMDVKKLKALGRYREDVY